MHHRDRNAHADLAATARLARNLPHRSPRYTPKQERRAAVLYWVGCIVAGVVFFYAVTGGQS